MAELPRKVQLLSPAGPVTFTRRNLQPPSELYITPDDLVSVTANSSFPAMVLTVQSRILDLSGVVRHSSQAMRPPSDRTRIGVELLLGEGFLLGLAFILEVAGVRRGQCFVTAAVNSSRAGGVPVIPLVSGYLDDNSLLGWPPYSLRSQAEEPGLMRTIVGTNPAAGAEISESVPTDARWRLVGTRFQLVTDGTVINRRVQVSIDDGVNVQLHTGATDVQVAGETKTYNAGAWGAWQADVSNQRWLALPPDIELLGGYRIRTDTLNLQAGDDYGAPVLLVEEWIDEGS